MKQPIDMQLLDAHDLNQPEKRKRALYDAFASRDTRFDGQVFVGVSSTKIYCRTVCAAQMPKFENCTFFHTAAEAEAAGYRPCMTCRPEVAPGLSNVDARSSLARRAAALLREECSSGISVNALAARLGYTDRHLRRVFTEEFGVTPIQYLQTCRLLLAKSLLTDSNLPVSQTAQAAGFGSVRRFNHLFKKHYRLTPTDLRRAGKTGRRSNQTDGITIRLGYRPPYLFDELLDFFRMRALVGVELIDDCSYSRTVRITAPDGKDICGWVRIENDLRRSSLVATLSEELLPVVPQVTARIRRQFDTDCDPTAIATGIASLDETVPGAVKEGLRLPGCFDPFETACRAVLGQQVSVKAANRLAARIVEEYGTPIDTGIVGLESGFPSAAELLALDSIEEAFGILGVIRTRSRTIAEIARLMESGKLDLGPGAIIGDQMKNLLDIKGIGPWSANYIAMRTLGYTDAFLETDSGVAHALGMTPKERLLCAERWHPWRSYAVVSLWNSLAG